MTKPSSPPSPARTAAHLPALGRAGGAAGLFIALLLTASCTTTPDPAPRRGQAQALAHQAYTSQQHQHWQQAALQWQHAAMAFARIDDWADSGLALLGQAIAEQAMAGSTTAEPTTTEQRQPATQQARATLHHIETHALIPETVKAEANYQHALLEFQAGNAPLAHQLLAQAINRVPSKHPLLASVHNLQARLHAHQQDWPAALHASTQALAHATTGSPEAANALYRQGEALARMAQTSDALPRLEQALSLNRQLARPAALRDNHCLLAEILSATSSDTRTRLHAASCQQLRQLETQRHPPVQHGLVPDKP